MDNRRLLYVTEIYMGIIWLIMGLASLIMLMFDVIPWIIIVFTGLWVVILGFVTFFYIPLFCRHASCKMDDDRITVRQGAVMISDKFILIRKVMYISILTDPIGRLFDISAVVVFTAGNFVVIPGLKRQKALLLKKKIAEEMDGAES